MKKICILAFSFFVLMGGVVVSASNFKYGFKATHAEVHVEEHTKDFIESSHTLGFGDKGHVEVIELNH